MVVLFTLYFGVLAKMSFDQCNNFSCYKLLIFEKFQFEGYFLGSVYKCWWYFKVYFWTNRPNVTKGSPLSVDLNPGLRGGQIHWLKYRLVYEAQSFYFLVLVALAQIPKKHFLDRWSCQISENILPSDLYF